MIKVSLLPVLLLALPLVSSPVVAAPAKSMDMEHMSPAQALSPASQAYMAAMGDMHQDMAEGVKDSDPDVAFAQGMIPHHQGAIAMAETELKYGKDPQMRQLAQNVIKAQKAEIEAMKTWLKAHHHAPGAK